MPQQARGGLRKGRLEWSDALPPAAVPPAAVQGVRCDGRWHRGSKSPRQVFSFRSNSWPSKGCGAVDVGTEDLSHRARSPRSAEIRSARGGGAVGRHRGCRSPRQVSSFRSNSRPSKGCGAMDAGTEDLSRRARSPRSAAIRQWVAEHWHWGSKSPHKVCSGPAPGATLCPCCTPTSAGQKSADLRLGHGVPRPTAPPQDVEAWCRDQDS